MLPLVLGGTALLVGAVWHKTRKQKSLHGVLTEDRKYLLQRALDGKFTPDKYRTLADGFEAQGLPEAAQLLRNRAALGEMTPAQKQALNELAQKALASTKPEGILAVANHMRSIGATGTAAVLANHAKVTASAAAIPATPPTTVPVSRVASAEAAESAAPVASEPVASTEPKVKNLGDLTANAATSQSGAVPAGQPAQP